MKKKLNIKFNKAKLDLKVYEQGYFDKKNKLLN